MLPYKIKMKTIFWLSVNPIEEFDLLMKQETPVNAVQEHSLFFPPKRQTFPLLHSKCEKEIFNEDI